MTLRQPQQHLLPPFEPDEGRGGSLALRRIQHDSLDLFAVAISARIPHQTDKLRYILHAVDDVAHVAIGVLHGRIDRTPIAFLEPSALGVRPANVVFQDGHGVHRLRSENAVQGGGQIAHSGRVDFVRIVGEHVEQTPAANLVHLRQSRVGVRFAGGDDGVVGLIREKHQIEPGGGLEQSAEIRFGKSGVPL